MGLLDSIVGSTERLLFRGAEVLTSFSVGLPLPNPEMGGKAPMGPNSFSPGPPPPEESREPLAKTRATIPRQNRDRRKRLTQLVRFRKLRAVARNYPAASSSIKQLVRAVRNSKFEVVLSDPLAELTPADKAAIKLVTDFFRRPDRSNGYTLKQFLSFGEREIAEIGVFVTWPWQTKGGGLYSLKCVDGSTMMPLTGFDGSIPQEHDKDAPEIINPAFGDQSALPVPYAFSQELNGRIWWNFGPGEILYAHPDPLSDEFLPRSATDDALGVLVTSLLELIAQQDLAERHGHLTVFVEGPEAKTGEDLEELTRALELEVNKQMPPQGGVVNIVPLMHGSNVHPLPGIVFNIDREEFRIRQVRQAYGLSPAPNVRDLNRGSSETLGDVEEQTLTDRLEWWGEYFTTIVHRYFGFEQLEVRLTAKTKRDPLKAAQAHEIELRAKFRDVKEIRDEEGYKDNPALVEAYNKSVERSLTAPMPGEGNPFGKPAPFGKTADGEQEPKPGESEPPPVAEKAASKVHAGGSLANALDSLAKARTAVLVAEAEKLYHARQGARDGA